MNLTPTNCVRLLSLSLACAILAFAFFSCSVARSQTNSDADLNTALSNVMFTVNQLKLEAQAAKSNSAALSQVQTVTFSNGVPIATNSIAAPVFTPAKINNWLESATAIVSTIGGLLAALVILARSLRKLIPDAAQVNDAGVLLATLGGEINPSKAKLAAAAAAPDAPIPTAPLSPVPPQPLIKPTP
jgi:hypothetical protein